ncbi:MAG: DUF2884 family protein [Gammaproteobacteria bacterium]|nr:DUF2884 family protein [Gammaproteobacteria bacterium]
MSVTKSLLSFLLLAAALSVNPVQASECPIQLKMGLLIAPDHIRILGKGRTQIQINHDKELFIRGEQISLTPEQQQLVKRLSLGLRKELPEIVAIAMDSVELGFKALDGVIEGIAGSDAAKGINEHFMELKVGLLKRFARSGDNFYLAPQGFNELDDYFKREVSEQVREVITGSLNVMLTAMGQAYNSNESDVEGQRIDLDERAELIRAEIEKSLQVNATRLNKESAAFCRRFEALEEIETQLQNHLPQLIKYDILANQSEH